MERDKMKYPICPINLYFEGDENKCDSSKCDWDTDTRSCNNGCERFRYNKSYKHELDEILGI